MQLTIIGLSKSGKTTIFNALAAGRAQTGSYGGSEGKANLGTAKVPDARLSLLASSFNPRKVVPAEVNYVDLPAGTKGFGASEGIGGQFLTYLQQADALVHVVRAFEDPALPHPQGKVDPFRDIGTLDVELAFTDLALLERRVQKLGEQQKSNKQSERDAAARELGLLMRVKGALEKDRPAREMTFTEEESKALSTYALLTLKPMLVAVNVGEEGLADMPKLEAQVRERFQRSQVKVVAMCGKLEEELTLMGKDDALEFRKSMPLGEAGADKVIRESYALLGLQNFFTVGQDEVRAWTIQVGTPAVKAAGKVHSDIERGFIRAEALAYEDFAKINSPPALVGEKVLVEARKRGLLRQEGKTYLVKDGDIIEFLFNV